MASYPWFRTWNDILSSVKVLKLSDGDYRKWSNLLAVANQSKPRGTLPCIGDICIHLRCDEDSVVPAIARLIDAELIDDNNGVLSMHDWDEWQPASDGTSTQRSRECRQRKRNVAATLQQQDCNGSATRLQQECNRPDTETEAEAEGNPPTPFATRMQQERNVAATLQSPPSSNGQIHDTQSPMAASVIAKAKERWEAIDLDAEIQANELVRCWGAELAGQALDKTFRKLGKSQKPWNYANTICRGGLDAAGAKAKDASEPTPRYYTASKDVNELYEREKGKKT